MTIVSCEVLSKLEDDEILTVKTVFGDEDTFHLSGHVTQHKHRKLGSNNQHAVTEITSDNSKFNVFCAPLIECLRAIQFTQKAL